MSQAGADIELAAGDHVVHFYEDDADLVSVVVAYLRAAVGDGEPAIVIASPWHRAAVVSALRDAGVDAAGAEARGTLVLLDAAETLARFMVDGAPDAGAFDAVVGSVLRGAAAGGRRVQAYGEMVALLWDAGDVVGAIELERLWENLSEETPFSLLCAYPRRLMDPPDNADAVAEICHVHSDVIAPAPVAEGAERVRRFPRSRHAPGLARRFVTKVLEDWRATGALDEAKLVVTELATNAVEHAQSSFAVSLLRSGDTLRVAVGDCGGDPPRARPLGDGFDGRGLHLIEAFAVRWGHTSVPDGKLVWADLAL